MRFLRGKLAARNVTRCAMETRLGPFSFALDAPAAGATRAIARIRRNAVSRRTVTAPRFHRAGRPSTPGRSPPAAAEVAPHRPPRSHEDDAVAAAQPAPARPEPVVTTGAHAEPVAPAVPPPQHAPGAAQRHHHA